MLSETEPLSLTEALAGPNKQQWLTAFHNEIRNILRLGVFRAIDRSNNSQPLSAKLVFKTKLDKNGEIEKYKVKLIARSLNKKKALIMKKPLP